MYPQIMGILNYTPDSFSDGGKYFSPELAEKRAFEMVSQGADIIDVGCNSTRPGSEILTQEEELERLKAVLPVITSAVDAPVSVDTFYPGCALYSLENGATVINDVSGDYNEEIAEYVRKYGASYVVTHNPCGADEIKEYPDGVISDISLFFDDCIAKAAVTGIKPENLILDPGFGFGKSRDDNYKILKNLSSIKKDGFRLLAGISRKRFIRIHSASESDYATCAADLWAMLCGADIIRVHNVFAAAETRRVINTIRGNSDG